jgi:hypothetical protein
MYKHQDTLRRCKNTQSVKETLKTLTFFLLKFCKPPHWVAEGALVNADFTKKIFFNCEKMDFTQN